MFKKIDIYIAKLFFTTFFLAIILIVLIVIAFDLSEKIGDFIERQAPLNEILFVYYLNFIPYFVNLFSPLFTFIAVVFFTSRLSARTEIVAMLSSGISYYRILRPYVFCAAFLAFMNFALTNFIIPSANKKRLAFEEKYVKTIKKSRGRNIHLQLSPKIYAFVESFNLNENKGYRFTLEHIDFDYGLLSKIHAQMIVWDSITSRWKLKDCFLRTFQDNKEQLQFIAERDTAINMYPHDFRRDTYILELMNFKQLKKFIEDERIKGNEGIVFYEIEHYRRTAFPFATIILTLIAVAVSSRKLRGGTGLHLGIGMVIGFGYILMMQISTTFATNANFPPLLAVWTPNIIFLIIAIYLILKTQK